MSLFSMLFKIGVDGTAFDVGMKRVQSTGKAFAKDFKKEVGDTLAGMFAVEKVAEYGKKAVDLAGKLTDLSNKIGVSASFLQEMSYAAELGGASLDDVSSSLEKMSIARSKALGGDSAMVEAFAKLGVSAEMLRTARLEDIFAKVGAAFEGGINPQPLLGALREIAGKSSTALIPAMADGLQDAAEKARTLGLVMEDEVVTALDDIGDRISTMFSGLTVLFGKVSAFLLPILSRLEAAGSVLTTAYNLVSDPKANSDKNPLTRAQFFFSQLRQSYNASLDEQEQEAMDAAAKKERTRALRNRLGDFESLGGETAKASTAPLSTNLNLGQAADPMARIGGFTAFGVSQDRVIQNLQEQVRQLAHISRNTEETSRVLKS